MKSSWVNTELYTARKREIKENKKVLFPISLVSYPKLKDWESFDADSGKDLAREVREYFIPDFTNWKEEEVFSKNFGILLKSLTSEESLSNNT